MNRPPFPPSPPFPPLPSLPCFLLFLTPGPKGVGRGPEKGRGEVGDGEEEGSGEGREGWGEGKGGDGRGEGGRWIMKECYYALKGVFTPRTTFCSKLHFIIYKWMVLLPVNESIPYKSHNLLKITLWYREASLPVPRSITSCLLSNFTFCFVRNNGGFLFFGAY